MPAGTISNNHPDNVLHFHPMSYGHPTISLKLHTSYGPHLLDHLAADGAGFAGGQVTVVTVVSQVLERVKGMNVVQINALVDELLDKVLTDMTNSDITTCITELLPLLPEMTMDSLQCPNADMDLSGKLIDLFKDGSPEQSIQTFTESKAKAIITAITEDD